MDAHNDWPGGLPAVDTPSEVPWPTPQSWQAANQVLRDLIIRYDGQLDDCRLFAESVRRHLDAIDPMMETVCAATCPWCPDACCMKATVWFGFPDLLFMYLIGADIPPGQPKVRRGGVCAYLGPRGCRLPRHRRPWTCTRYICPTQKRWWQAPVNRTTDQAGDQPMVFDDLVQKIRKARQEMETAFIAVVSGHCLPL